MFGKSYQIMIIKFETYWKFVCNYNMSNINTIKSA